VVTRVATVSQIKHTDLLQEDRAGASLTRKQTKPGVSVACGRRRLQGLTFDVISAERNQDENNLDREAQSEEETFSHIIPAVDTNDLHRSGRRASDLHIETLTTISLLVKRPASNGVRKGGDGAYRARTITRRFWSASR